LGRLSLSIQDDGQGFDAQQSKGLGLLGMEERVTRLGGRFEVHSKPGNGTVLTVELPLAGSEESGDAHHADSHSVSG
jgi:signal transduction histidine kinase